MPHARRSSARALAVLLAAAVAGPVAPAWSARAPADQPTRDKLEAAERARAAELAAQRAAAARAAAAEADEQRLAAQRVEAAARLQQAEAATGDAATRMEALLARRKAAAEKLAVRAAAMQPLLPLIERLSLYPAETLLAVPAPPEQTLRGVLVLQGIAGDLQQQASALRQEQAALDAATRAVQAEAPKLAEALAAQQAEAAALDQQIDAARAARTEAQADADAAAAHAADQAATADNLRGMLTRLEEQRRAAAEQAREAAARAERERQAATAAAARQREAALARPAVNATLATASQPKGQLTAPVAGKIARAWGENTDGGPATGISYHAAPAARVVSPCSGRVVFAAPFRSYGLLMIVDCGGGYHVVLAGFERLDAQVGQSVQSGEPVGVMPSWQPGSGQRPSLYIELRHSGQPINPAPWLKAVG